MPYSNIPRSKWSKMEKCTKHVKVQKGSKNAYAICYTSVMGKKKKRKKRGKG